MPKKYLETRCPVCGSKNAPVEFTAELDIGTGAKVTAKYCCTGKVRRIFRPAKPCQTKYRIELRCDTAEQIINEIYLAGGTNYDAKAGKEG